MPPHVKNERARLLRVREKLLKTWAASDPVSAAQFRAVEAALEVLSQSPSDRYSRIRSSIDAIRACLTFEQRRLTKNEIADKLFDGGFPMDPEIGRRLIVVNINKNVQRGHVDVDKQGLVGLPEWNGLEPSGQDYEKKS